MTPTRMNTLLKITLVVCIVVGIGVLYFANGKLTQVAQQTARLKADALIGQKQIETYQKTKTQVESLSYVDDLANRVLPPDKDQSAIVAEVSEFALRSGLTINQITFNDTAKSAKPAKGSITIPKGVNTVPVSLQFAAGAKYDKVLNFLKTLEDNRRKSQVTNISLTPDSKDRSRLSQVTIAFNLYFRQSVGSTKQ